MANRKMFETRGAGLAVADVKNLAGGRAYSMNDEHALAQAIVTGTFNQTFYASEESQVEKILDLSRKCWPEFVAKAAVYGHEVAKMKDAPALMLAVLAGRAKSEPEIYPLLTQAFPRVVTRFKMLQNFVQFIRSGKAGRRSFGYRPKRLIREWLASRSGDQLFTGSIGANPSFADVIKMIRPAPESPEKKALYGYFIGREHNFDDLPTKVREFEQFKRALGVNQIGNDDQSITPLKTPNVPFLMLTSLPLTKGHWRDIALNLPWNALRMNLNTLGRHGVFDDKQMVEKIAAKLADPGEVRRSSIFPYQLFTAFTNIDGSIPNAIRLALQDAMEVATENVPDFGSDGVAVLVDVSSSMSHPVTGIRQGSTTVTSCVQVASLFAASVMRKNADAMIVPFDTQVHVGSRLNPRDSIMTNANVLSSFRGGGTDVSSGLRHLNTILRHRPKVVVIVSDNESWFSDQPRYSWGGHATNSAVEWEAYRRRTPGAKLICIDLTPNASLQVKDSPDVLNIGGFSDKVWPAIENFVKKGGSDFAKLIREMVSLEVSGRGEELDQD